MLELEDGLGVEEVQLALAPPLVLAALPQVAVGGLLGPVEVGEAVPLGGLLGEHVEADAAELRGRAGEVLVDEVVARGRSASKIWAPVYDATVDTPIFDMTLSTPLPHAFT